MARSWTPEERARQRGLIADWAPWKKSTGPKSTEGKAVVARNAYKGDPRGTLKALRRLDRLIEADAVALTRILSELPESGVQ